MAVTGQYMHLVNKRDAVLSTARVSPADRARIMGLRLYQPIVEAPKQMVAAPLPAARPAPLSPIQPRIPIPDRLNLSTKGRRRGGNAVPDHAGMAAKARDVITVFAEVFQVEVEGILSRRLSKKYARPRQAAMYLMAKHLRLSQTTIGAILQRDHTTVTSANILVTRLLVEDLGFRCRYEYATDRLRQLWSML